ncbi:TAP-like protein-domain-containing protein [Clohesyomyces aquaticus]|uniref:TAP-like protein-domain-containing protein n=1 Tax=Clohesyomyces aquaticus TaxID=1231657 RepID=A0A1Y1ZQZ0_9PLEO|nr:TAP-like protein-domain-containing protein [Clohesyomyces aquaticus]
MLFPYLIFFALLSSLATAKPKPTCTSDAPARTHTPDLEDIAKIYSKITPSTNITWVKCLDKFYCANLDVPLSYGTPNGTRNSVPLIKLAANAEPYKGMIITNPGDLVDLGSWEPRGVGISVPAADGCSNTTSNGKRQTPLLGDDRYSKLYDMVVKKGAACSSAIGGADQAGPNMHTTVVVNDMISIVDAYARTADGKIAQNPTLVNFWGESYGTIVGQYFASIYPERVGRFFLDGAVDPDDWVGAFAYRSSQSTDEAFASFFIYCNLAGPFKGFDCQDYPIGCPYYTGTTSDDIWNRFNRLIDQLDPRIASGNNWKNATAIEFGLVSLKSAIMQNLYYAYSQFPRIAGYLLDLEEIVKAQNITIDGIKEVFQPKKPLHSHGRGVKDSSDDALTAVSCSDASSAFRDATFQQVLPYARLLESQSWLYAGEDAYQCVGWQIDPIGPYFSGPFGGETKNPILFGSSTRDPVTPILSALKGTSLFKDARLLTVEGTGHCTSSQDPNKCVKTKLYNFWQTGQLPSTDDHCPSENGPFGIQKGYRLEETPSWRPLLRALENMALDAWTAYGPNLRGSSP